MWLRMLGMLLVVATGLGWAGHAKAWESCQDVVIGMQGNQPIFQRQCVWLAGAVALDPVTRAMGAVWNYSDAGEAKAVAQQQCGARCLVVSFYDDYFFMAASDEDVIGYGSTAAAALNQCKAVSPPLSLCNVVVSAGSGGAPVYRYFNALAYNSTQQRAYTTVASKRRGEARNEVLQKCGGEPDCFVFVHQQYYAAMAMGDDGRLYAAEDDTARRARAAASKYCKQEQGKKAKCEVVAESDKTERELPEMPAGLKELLEKIKRG